MPFRFRDAIRISFWGYLLNMAPLGIVGGDVVKAVMLDHEYPHYRAKALASVLFDRVVGLYLLFVVASVALLMTGFWRTDVRRPPGHLLCHVYRDGGGRSGNCRDPGPRHQQRPHSRRVGADSARGAIPAQRDRSRADVRAETDWF